MVANTLFIAFQADKVSRLVVFIKGRGRSFEKLIAASAIGMFLPLLIPERPTP